MSQPMISQMIGKTFVKVEGAVGGEGLKFTTADGECFSFSHDQDCCESVRINETVGNLADLEGVPLLMADESSNRESEPKPHECADSWTWTFYKFGTMQGYVDVRWLGESNGYYGEGVDLHYAKGNANG